MHFAALGGAEGATNFHICNEFAGAAAGVCGTHSSDPFWLTCKNITGGWQSGADICFWATCYYCQPFYGRDGGQTANGERRTASARSEVPLAKR